MRLRCRRWGPDVSPRTRPPPSPPSHESCKKSTFCDTSRHVSGNLDRFSPHVLSPAHAPDARLDATGRSR
ncbi:hypothetical protein [Azospirillum doebereinerae]